MRRGLSLPGRTVPKAKPWYKRDRGARLESDRQLVAGHFPDLEYKVDEEKETISLEGAITFRSDCGVKRRVEIRVVFPARYPDAEPITYEVGNRFPHVIDRHIFSDGRLCLWLPPESLWDRSAPNALLDYLHHVAVFLDKQFVCDALGGSVFPGEARSHGDLGYIEYIEELLGSDRDLLKALKPVFINSSAVGRNDLCPCGRGLKFKRCHSEAVAQVIRRVGVIKVRDVFQRWNEINVPSEKHAQSESQEINHARAI